jgi:Ca-activated chloride channel family protein
MHSQIKWLTIFIAIVFVQISTGNLFAGATDDHTLSPYFYIENGDPSLDHFPLKQTEVDVNIIGVIAEVRVNQRYSNDGARPIHARYIFPASTRAAVHGMTMSVGQQIIKAEIKERQKAQAEYNQAKNQGQNASLLNQDRPNVFSINVANIMPGDEIEIELHYTELLVPTEGIYEFVYPTVVGPRYADQLEPEAPEHDLWVNNPYLHQGEVPPTKFNIGVTLSTGIALQEIVCSTHETEIFWESESVAAVGLRDPENFGGDRDYILKFRLAGKEIQSGLMLYEGREESFFLLMVQPPERVQPLDIPPRDYIFVVDISGSMHGFPLNTAKKLLRNLIGNLRPTDTFNVILFAGGSRMMNPVSVTATPRNIRRAIQLIDKKKGGGGTELLAAMQKGYALPRDETCSRTMIIVTDGYIGAEREVFAEIQNNLDRTNVFAFGIGSGVNRYLIEGIAKAGLGEPFIVTKPGEASVTARKFRHYIQSPVLTNINVDYDGFETYDIEPAAIPDLFAKRPILVFGKWNGKPQGTITLTGSGGSAEYTQTFPVDETRPLEANRSLRYLWARTRIARLSDFYFYPAHYENTAEITRLGLTYNLLTAHTSFIAVNDVIVNPQGDAEEVDQPQPLPLNVSNMAVGGTVSSVPEPELYVMLVMVAMLLSFICIVRKLRMNA